MRLRGVGHLAHFVALAITPRTGGDRVRRVTSRPIAKSVVVLANKHDHFAAEVRDRVHPLIRVQRRWIKDRSLFAARAPLGFVERVHTEVEEERPLQTHPVCLILARQNLRRFLRDDGIRVTVGNHLLGGIRNWRGHRSEAGERTAQRQQIQFDCFWHHNFNLPD